MGLSQRTRAQTTKKKPPRSPSLFPQHLQIPRPHLTPRNPLPQALRTPRPKPDLELLRLGRQARLDIVALQRIEDRLIALVLWRQDVERADQADEGRVQLSVCQVGTDAHPRTGAVTVVGRSGAFGGVEIALGEEGRWVFEVCAVVVGCPCVLFGQLNGDLANDGCVVGAYHVECGACGDGGILVLNVFDADPGQTDWDDRPEA